MNHVLFSVNHTPFLVSHRLQLVKFFKEKGYICSVIAGRYFDKNKEIQADNEIRDQNISLLKNKFSMLFHIYQVHKCSSKLILFHISIKNILIGVIIALFVNRATHVFVFSGLGSLLSSDTIYSRMILLYLRFMYYLLLLKGRNAKIIVQNSHDKEFCKANFSDIEVICVPGSGVKVADFAERRWSERNDKIVFLGRVLKDKGILDFIEAAKLLKSENYQFYIAGDFYPTNPSALSERELSEALLGSKVEYVGFVDDLPKFLSDVKVVCLPSYHEGLPKAVIDGLAAGCAIVTTDAPGCNESICDGEQGYLIPTGQPEAIASAISKIFLKGQSIDWSRDCRDFARARYEIGTLNEMIFGEVTK